VRLQALENEAVALREVTSDAAEHKRLRMPRRRRKRDVERVVDPRRPEPKLRELRALELAAREEVTELERGEATRVEVVAHRVGSRDHLPVVVFAALGERRRWEAFVAGPVHVHEAALPNPVLLGVRNPIGRHEPAELREQRRRERLVSGERVGLGDECEDLLRVACSELLHTARREHTTPRISGRSKLLRLLPCRRC
jgi:hypothetical protein